MFKHTDFLDQKRMSFAPVLTGLLVAGIILFALNIFKWSSLNEEILDKKDKIAEVAKFNKSLNSKVIDVPSIKVSDANLNWLNNLNAISPGLGFNWNIIYFSLERRVPKEVTLTSVAIDFKTLKVGITGRALSFSDIGQFTSNLNESKIFKNIDLTKISTSKQDNAIFQLALELVQDSPLLFETEPLPSKAPVEVVLKKNPKKVKAKSKIGIEPMFNKDSPDIPALVPEPILQGNSHK